MELQSLDYCGRDEGEKGNSSYLHSENVVMTLMDDLLKAEEHCTLITFTLVCVFLILSQLNRHLCVKRSD